jgi:hypothetical protein
MECCESWPQALQDRSRDAKVVGEDRQMNKKMMMVKELTAGLLSAAALILFCGTSGAQVLKGSTTQRLAKKPALAQKSALKSNKIIQSALTRSVRVSATGIPGGMADGSTRTIIATLRRQSTAARSLLARAVGSGVTPPSPNPTLIGGSGGASPTGTLLNPGTTSGLNLQPLPPKGSPSPAGTSQTSPIAGSGGRTLLNGGSKVALNPQPLPPKGTPQIGAEHTMSASGTQSTLATSPTATQVNQTSGPTAHQAPGGRQPLTQPIGAQAPLQTQLCKTGIAAVDGAANGVWFSPVSGPDGQFVIQGCGFGSIPGEVYLSGVQYDSSQTKQTNRVARPIGILMCAGCVYFTIPPNQWKNGRQFIASWSDRQIIADIDANASGFYDTNNVTLVVKTASGQVYQAPGMNFAAARADQVLKGLPLPPGCTPQNSGPGCFPPDLKLSKVNPNDPPFTEVESPSLALLTPGETVAVSREYGTQFPIPMSPGASFPGGTDTYQLNLAPGFQLDPQTGVNLRHASIDVGYCQSVNGVYSNSGQWALNYTSKTSFQISWEEEGCWPKNTMTNGTWVDLLNYASVSAYELEIVVWGPRGVSPWASGNPLMIKQLPNVMPLKKP